MRGLMRWVAVGAVALAVLAVATALLTPASGRTSLDPDAATPGGARALAELLRDQGVSVSRTTDPEQAMATGSQATLVIAYPQLLREQDVQRVERLSADVVLLGPVVTPSGYLGVFAEAEADVRTRQPGCALTAAMRAGDARTGGFALAATPAPGAGEGLGSTVACYGEPEAPSLVQRTTAERAQHTVLGSAEFMTNEWIDEAGNASLALSLAGQNPSVVWWLPTPSYNGSQPLTRLLPDGVWPLLAVAVTVVLALAAWQGRRLGPVVVEPLPVAVRASETTEGRARIYQRYRTRDQAARHLRALTADAIAARLGLPPSATPDAVVAAVAANTGHRPDQVDAVLYGPPPEGDQELVSLGHRLATLEQEVRRT
jgi:hypothetical protein